MQIALARLIIVSVLVTACGGPTAHEQTTTTALTLETEALELAIRRCIDEGPNELDPTIEQMHSHVKACYDAIAPPIQFSEQQITRRYHLELEAMTCLRDQGYGIPDPPSLDVYIETFPPSGGRIFSDGDMFFFWSAHGFVTPNTGVSQEEYERLLRACPEPSLSSP